MIKLIEMTNDYVKVKQEGILLGRKGIALTPGKKGLGNEEIMLQIACDAPVVLVAICRVLRRRE